MSRISAGILLYRTRDRIPEILLVHPGGPYWKNKDAGAWSIPKGEAGDPASESLLETAKREFLEETGISVSGNFLPLSPVKQKSGKIVYAWALEGDLDPAVVRSNLFQQEWPPRSGRIAFFPEVDRAAWFSPDEAREKILPGQVLLLDELEKFWRQIGYPRKK